MFITKEEIKKAIKGEDCWKDLSPREQKMFLLYCTNGLEETSAYLDVYQREDKKRVIKFPGKLAADILAKQSFQACFNLYSGLIAEIAPTKVNAQLFNVYYNQAFYNIFDFMDENGEFRYTSVQEAKERLGPKAVAIQSIDTTMHPKDPNRVVRKVTFISRAKAMKELSRFTKFIEEESGAGSGMGNVVMNVQMPSFDPKEDEVNRKKYGFDQE